MHLDLFGGFLLQDNAGQVVRLPTRKAEALLAFLALTPGRLHARDALAGLLWGDAPGDKARASLRQTLSLLGKALGAGRLATEGRAVGLAADAIRTDALDFERGIAAQVPQQVEEAVRHYRGELLAGFSLDQPAFEEWLLSERERLRELAIDALARLAALYREADNPEAAILAAQRLLALDPLEEIAHRALMSIYASQGRRAAALRQYQVCLSTLRRELGTEPGAETRSLYNTLLQESVAATAAAPAPSGLALSSHETALLGREAELQRALAVLEAVRAPRPAGRVLAILGEAGIGKTRLGEELAAHALATGFRVLVGRCYESQQLFPLAPVADMLRSAGVPGDASLLASLGAAWRDELARLLPELGAGPHQTGDDEANVSRRGTLFEAIAQLFARLAAHGPLLVILEDLHWADELTLRLLAAAGRRMQLAPALLVATARDEELPGALTVARTLQELEKGGLLETLRLAPLSRDDTLGLVRALARTGTDAALTARLAEQIWQSSEGNPFVVLESMRTLPPSPTVPATPLPADGAQPGLPERVRGLIRSHLDRLGPAAQRMLAIAAVAGRELEFALLRRAAGQNDFEASDALEELVRRQILHAVGERFDFVHDRIRRVADESLLAPARGALHAAIAEALEALHAHAPDAVQDRLAYHYARTDRHEKAVHWLERFAESAARAGAHTQALAALDQALEHLGRLPADGSGRRRYALVFRKSRSLLLLGQLQETAELLAAERAWVDGSADPLLAGPFYLRLGAICNYLGDRKGTEQAASRALAEATACGDVPTMGKAHVVLGNVYFWSAPEQGVRHGEQALALLEGSGERWWLGQACWILGLNLSYRGRFAEGLRMQERARLLGEATGDRRLSCSAAWGSGFIHTLAGDREASVAECRRAVALAPDPLSRMVASGMLALALVECRETAQASGLLEQAIPQAEQFRFWPLHGLYLGFRAETCLQSGDLVAAEELAARAITGTRRAGYLYGLGWSQRIAARIARAAQDHDNALAHYRAAIDTFAGMRAPYESGRTRLELARWLSEAGEAAPAHEANLVRQLAAAALGELQPLGLDALARDARGLLAGPAR